MSNYRCKRNVVLADALDYVRCGESCRFPLKLDGHRHGTCREQPPRKPARRSALRKYR